MKQTPKLILVVGAMMTVLPFMAMAETTGTLPPPPTAARAEIEAKRVEARQAIEAKKVEIKDARENFQTDIKQKREEVKDLRASTTREIKGERADIRAGIQDKRNEMRLEEMKNRVVNTVRMLAVTTDRFDKIVLRIESRIAKINTAKGDTTVIQTELNKVKADIAVVRTKIENIKQLAPVGELTTDKTKFEQIKAETKLVKGLYEGIKDGLEKINKDLRDLSKTKKVNDEAPKELETEKPATLPTAPAPTPAQ